MTATTDNRELRAMLERWLIRYNELIQMDRTNEAEQVLRCINEGKRLLTRTEAGADRTGWQDGWPMPYHTRFRDVLEQAIGQPFGEGTRLGSADIRRVAMAMAREFGVPSDAAPVADEAATVGAVAWQTMGKDGNWCEITSTEFKALRAAGIGKQRELFTHPQDASAGDRKDAARWRCLLSNWKRDHIWYHVFFEEDRAGHSSIESVVDAALHQPTKGGAL